MRIADMNWMQVEARVKFDNGRILPLRSTEQHAQLSLCVDAIVAERIDIEAAESLGVPVFPVMSYGFAAYYKRHSRHDLAAPRDARGLSRRDRVGGAGSFRRVLIVNGHGGNAPVGSLATEMMTTHPPAGACARLSATIRSLTR